MICPAPVYYTGKFKDLKSTITGRFTMKSIRSKTNFLKCITLFALVSVFFFTGFAYADSAPQAISLTPNQGTSTPGDAVDFTAVYQDADGHTNIRYSYLAINTYITSAHGFYAYYNTSQNKLYLRNDEGTAWTGGFTPGSANTIENSYSKLDCSQTTVQGSGNNLTITWNVAFKDTFLGTKNSYLFVRDYQNNMSGWKKMGTWKIELADKDQFVISSGNRLILEDSGKNYYFSIANQYRLFYKPLDTVDEVFDDAAEMGINVIRTWGFCDGMYKDDVSFQPEAGVYHDSGFERMDYLIQKAKEKGIRLIIPFVNNWSGNTNFGGMGRYVYWAQGNWNHDDFYTNPTCKDLYKDYVEHFMNRVNTLTDIAYKDDPTILMWELANEPRCTSDITGDTLQAWIEEMSEFIKNIDGKHLLSTGSEGWYDGTYGVDYIRNNQSEFIDVCSFHLLQNDVGFSDSQSLEWFTDHIDDAHFVVGKPAYCGEFGKEARRSAANFQELMDARNQNYSDWYAENLNRVADGAGFWLLSADSYPDGDHYTVYYPGDDQTCIIIRDFSSDMAQLRSLAYKPPILQSLEDKNVNEEELLEFSLGVSNPDNLDLSFQAQNMPDGALLDGNGDFSWPLPEAGTYNDIEVSIAYNGFVRSTEMNISVIDVDGDNTPNIPVIDTIIMDKNTTLDNAIDLWSITTDDETPVDQLIFTANPQYTDFGVSLDNNRYIDINPTHDYSGNGYVTITATDQRGLKGQRSFTLYIKKNAVIRVPVDYLTITEAVPNATFGDTILVGSGTYYEKVSLNQNQDISLISESGPYETIIDATGEFHGVSGAGTVQGFTIRNANGPGVKKTQKVINNIIENNNEQGVLMMGGNNKIVANNIIRNNPSSTYGGGIRCTGGNDDSKVVNNVIIGNMAQDGGGIYISDGADLLVANNIITNNTVPSYGGGIRVYNSNPTIIYNNVWNNSPNDIYGHTPGEGSISEDPLFVSEASGDYRLQAASPSVDTGNPDSSYNDIDGSRNDMGVYGGPGAIPSIPLAPSIVTTDDYRLIVQKRNPDGSLEPAAAYIMKGVCWSAASKGIAGPEGNETEMRNQFGLWSDTDIPLIWKMNANTIRTFMDFGRTSDGYEKEWNEILDECYLNNIMVVISVDRSIADMTRIAEIVPLYKDHPAVLMWVIGNEWPINNFYGAYPDINDGAAAVENAAQLIKSLDTNHPVVSSIGDITHPSFTVIKDIVNNVCPAVDVWSFNIYRGRTFLNLFDQWKDICLEGVKKPMFLAEFGCDAYDINAGQEDQTAQRTYEYFQWEDILKNLSADDLSRVCIGGNVFEFNDEWWKVKPVHGGDPWLQDTGGWDTENCPDGHASEEWWGLVDIDRNPRQNYQLFKEFFGGIAPIPPPPSAYEDYNVVRFSTQPDTITTNLENYIIADVFEDATEIRLNGTIVVQDTYDGFIEDKTLTVGNNVFTIEVTFEDASQENYQKTVIYDPTYSTAAKKLLYVGDIAIDLDAGAVIGRLPVMPSAGTHDGKYFVTGQNSYVYSTADNKATAKQLNIGTRSCVFSNDDQTVYSGYEALDFETNTIITDQLPVNITSVDSTVAEDGFIFHKGTYSDDISKISPVTFTVVKEIPHTLARNLYGGIGVSRDAALVFLSSYSYGNGALDIIDVNTEEVTSYGTLSAWTSDYTGDIVMSHDGTKAFLGCYGNSSNGEGRIYVIDKTTKGIDSLYPQFGARRLTVSPEYLFATSTCKSSKGSRYHRGIEVLKLNSDSELEYQKSFFFNLEHDYSMPIKVFYKKEY